jgi:hypothetical protein
MPSIYLNSSEESVSFSDLPKRQVVCRQEISRNLSVRFARGRQLGNITSLRRAKTPGEARRQEAAAGGRKQKTENKISGNGK